MHMESNRQASGNGDRSDSLAAIVEALDIELSTLTVPDYPGALNGLQFGNRGRIRRVAVAVDASRQAIVECARASCELLIVHHGLFWNGVQPITGISYEKVAMLVERDIAVYSSHLPLDVHPVHGNNVRLAQALSLSVGGGFARYKQVDVGVQGSCDEPTHNIVQRVQAFAANYGGSVRTSVPVAGRHSRRWAICTGSGASTETIAEAVSNGIDTLIVGEGPHHTTVGAIEHDLCIIYAGHYATETLGVQSIGAFVESRFGLPSTFLMLPTGS
jgi:dinuclear metal center YbgI/SA1388 family protein